MLNVVRRLLLGGSGSKKGTWKLRKREIVEARGELTRLFRVRDGSRVLQLVWQHHDNLGGAPLISYVPYALCRGTRIETAEDLACPDEVREILTKEREVAIGQVEEEHRIGASSGPYFLTEQGEELPQFPSAHLVQISYSPGGRAVELRELQAYAMFC